MPDCDKQDCEVLLQRALESRVLVTKQSHSRYLNSSKRKKGNETSGKQNTENIDATNHAVLPPVVVIPCIALVQLPC